MRISQKIRHIFVLPNNTGVFLIKGDTLDAGATKDMAGSLTCVE